jgi:hypothetical protein
VQTRTPPVTFCNRARRQVNLDQDQLFNCSTSATTDPSPLPPPPTLTHAKPPPTCPLGLPPSRPPPGAAGGPAAGQLPGGPARWGATPPAPPEGGWDRRSRCSSSGGGEVRSCVHSLVTMSQDEGIKRPRCILAKRERSLEQGVQAGTELGHKHLFFCNPVAGCPNTILVEFWLNAY